jgi:hypothetical protein
LLRSELEHFRTHPEDAVKMAAHPLGPLPDGWRAEEAAAYTVVANVLLNLDAFLNKG